MSQELRMVAVLCVALVVVFMWVKGLSRISQSTFSTISLTLITGSVGKSTGFRGASQCGNFLKVFHCFRAIGFLRTELWGATYIYYSQIREFSF
jgi:hypothetical protein